MLWSFCQFYFMPLFHLAIELRQKFMASKAIEMDQGKKSNPKIWAQRRIKTNDWHFLKMDLHFALQLPIQKYLPPSNLSKIVKFLSI